MLSVEDIKQLRKVHMMIRKRITGTPEEFASVLCVSRRKMYYIMDVLRGLGAKIAYSRTNHTFYYHKDFELEISFKIKKSGCDEWQDIFGGFILVPERCMFRAIFLHGSDFLENIFA